MPITSGTKCLTCEEGNFDCQWPDNAEPWADVWAYQSDMNDVRQQTGELTEDVRGMRVALTALLESAQVQNAVLAAVVAEFIPGGTEDDHNAQQELKWARDAVSRER